MAGKKRDGPVFDPTADASSDGTAGSRSGKSASPLRSADEGFLKLGRAIGSVARYAESGIMSMGNKVGVGKTESVDQGPEFDWLNELPADVRSVVEEELKHLKAEEAQAAEGQVREAAPPRAAPAATPPKAAPSTPPKAAPAATPKRSAPVATQPKRSAPQRAAEEKARVPRFDIEGWLEREAAQDPVAGVAIRLAIDDWKNGSLEARREAVDVLISVGPAAEPLFIELLNGANATQTELALEALLRIGSTQFQACLADAARASTDEVRIAALRVAQRLESETAELLLTQAARDPSPRVRRRTVQWMSWRSEPWTQDRLWELCDDEAPTVQWAALRAMIPRDATNLKWRLERAKESDPGRCRLTTALLARHRGEPASRSEGTGEAARDTSEAELEALKALGRSRKPKRENSMQQTDVDERSPTESRAGRALQAGSSDALSAGEESDSKRSPVRMHAVGGNRGEGKTGGSA